MQQKREEDEDASAIGRLPWWSGNRKEREELGDVAVNEAALEHAIGSVAGEPESARCQPKTALINQVTWRSPPTT